jgi:hypothetical protein
MSGIDGVYEGDGVRIVVRTLSAEESAAHAAQYVAPMAPDEMRAAGLPVLCQGRHDDRPRSANYERIVDGVRLGVCGRHRTEDLDR